MLQTFCFRVTIRLQRHNYNSTIATPRLKDPQAALLHCYMLHVTLRIPHFCLRPAKHRQSWCKCEGPTGRVVTLLHCYMLHVTLRIPHFCLRPARHRSVVLCCTCCFSCFPLSQAKRYYTLYLLFPFFLFYSLAREKSNCSPPPSRALTRMLPRWRMTAFLTMASPSPVPPSERLRPLSTR